MKYRITLRETRYGSVTVDAGSPQEAKIMADEAYKEGKVNWLDANLQLDTLKKEIDRGEEER